MNFLTSDRGSKKRSEEERKRREAKDLRDKEEQMKNEEKRLREVEEEPQEDQRDAEDEYSEDEVERQEPLAPLSQEIALLGRSLCVAHLVTHVAQRLQLRGFAPIKSNRGREGTNPVDQTAG